MDKYPQITFLLNEDWDIVKIFNFLTRTDRKGGDHFQEDILNQHPQLKDIHTLSESDQKSKIEAYVKNYYLKYHGQLENSLPLISEKWQNYSPFFFEVADKIFKNLKWRQGPYIGSPSISSPFPRSLEYRNFQFPFDMPNNWLDTISHEMLHFIFYEYVRLRYTPQLSNIFEDQMNQLLKNKFPLPLWELAESFNIALPTKDRFKEGGDEHSSYPALINQAESLKHLWQKVNGDIDDFFTKIEVN